MYITIEFYCIEIKGTCGGFRSSWTEEVSKAVTYHYRMNNIWFRPDLSLSRHILIFGDGAFDDMMTHFCGGV